MRLPPPRPVCLPPDDADPGARRDALTADRAAWRFDLDLGLPLAAKVEGESYSAAFGARFVEASAMLLATRAAAALDPRLAGARQAAREAGPDAGDPPKQKGGVRRASMVPVGSASDYDALFNALPAPATRRWATDDLFFAWQRLAGCNPTLLRRHVDDPALAVTEGHFAAAARHLRAGEADSLARARAEGRLYGLDLGALQGLARGATQGRPRYFDGARGLFVRSLDGRLRPVAVRPSAAPGSPLVTPADGERWRHAKLDLQVADSIWAGAVMHIGLHALAGAFQVCTARALAPNHPLRALLWPHFEMTASANETMKVSVLGEGGYFDELMAPTREACVSLAATSLRARPLAARSPWRDVAARGADDLAALPEYPYRDDGLLVAGALRRWVAAYLGRWYRDDGAVAADPELRAWLDALAAGDGPAFTGLPAPGGVTLAALVDLVTTVLFEVTVGHAAVNYSGYDHYAWPETYPTARWAPPPAADAAPTPADYEAALAPLGVADRMLDLTLPQRQLRLNALGEYPAGWCDDAEVAALERTYRAELEAAEREIVARDAGRRWSYPYLAPSRVARSIHV